MRIDQHYAFVFWPHCAACGILLPQCPCSGSRSLNHWTAKEVPTLCFLVTQEASQELFQTPPALCQLPPVRGPCKASLHRYFYNSTSIECEPFTYGGCQGNANNFETTETCLKVCKLPGESSDGNRRSNGGDSMLGM
uniref:BPTI/Kunitz inhibitor domain-containing protein n=1 Tax=Balaenoptera musculus TaxID=9771 RepID=A0A8C0DMP6_BALMU